MFWSAGAPYRDRREAGVELAELVRRDLSSVRGQGAAELVVLGAPRGGVAVAAPVAQLLHAPLDVVLARKLPAPGNPELGFGAVGEGGVQVVDREIVELLGLGDDEIEGIARRVRAEIEERSRRYRRARAAVPLTGRTALVVDDGVATGVTMAAAIGSARSRGAVRVVAAAPVSSVEARSRLDEAADLFICPLVDPGFVGVGSYYEEFPQLSDEDVATLLESADRGTEAGKD